MVRLRHYWNYSKKQCDCGETQRVWILSQWLCLTKLKEMLKEQNYTIIKKGGVKSENSTINTKTVTI